MYVNVLPRHLHDGCVSLPKLNTHFTFYQEYEKRIFSRYLIVYLKSDMFNANVTHFSRQGLAFQLFFLAWPRLLCTNTEPRWAIENYSGIFLVFFENCV